MLFKKNHLEGIRSGDIVLAFRKWGKQSVKDNSLVKTSIGIVRIKNVQLYNISQISQQEAQQAGYEDRDSLLMELNNIQNGNVYKISVSYYGADPRLALREKTVMDETEFRTLKDKLMRLDKFSKKGNWTIEVLKAIDRHPKLKATDLAVIVEQDKERLKLNVRKLKNLGLTISHEPGYTLSPYGRIFLDKNDKSAKKTLLR